MLYDALIAYMTDPDAVETDEVREAIVVCGVLRELSTPHMDEYRIHAHTYWV